MTERTAILLAYAAMLLVLGVAFVVLDAIGASTHASAIAFVLVLCVGTDIGSRVGRHYDNKPSSKHRDR
jgi:hypothetical protein